MSFYRDVDPQWCQGDLIREIPSLHLRPPLELLRKQVVAKGREIWAPHRYPGVEATPPLDLKTGEHASVFCQVSHGILLTHGCEIDKDKKHRLVAIIRPMASLENEADKEKVRTSRTFRFFHLPEDEGRGIPESYADFRRVTVVHPDFTAFENRIASLTELAVDALQLQFFRYLTRREFEPNQLTPPNPQP